MIFYYISPFKPSLFAKVQDEIKNLFRPSRQQTKTKSREVAKSNANHSAATTEEEEIHTQQRGTNKQRQLKRKKLGRSKSFTANSNTKRAGVYYGDEVNVLTNATFNTTQRLGYIRRGSCDNALEPIVHEFSSRIDAPDRAELPVTTRRTLKLHNASITGPSRRDAPDRGELPVTIKGTLNHHNANITGDPKDEHTGEPISYHGDLIDITGLMIDGKTNKEIDEAKTGLPGYIPMDVDVNSVMKEGCTDADFYKYTAIQTASCFRVCALCKLADLCYINRLDGYFFKHFDLNTLRQEPYNLNSIQILKVKKIIHNGWRPLNK